MALIHAPSGWHRPPDEDVGEAGHRSFWKTRAGVTIIGMVPALAAIIAYNVVPNLLWPPGEIAETWTTVEKDGMSLSLPSSFDVFTDVDDAAEAYERLSGEGEEAAGGLRAMSEVHVVTALHDSAESEYIVEVGVLRFPAEATGGATARDFADEVLGTPAPETTVLENQDVAVGAAGQEAVRIDVAAQLEGETAHETAFVIVDGEGAVWLIDYVAPVREYDRFEAVFERSIASLELP